MWKNIETQEDIILFMKKMNYFHDSCIKEVNFISGTYVDDDFSMVMNEHPSAEIIFQRQSSKYTTFILYLEDITTLCLNTDLTSTSEIDEAYLELENDLFTWYSDTDYKVNMKYVSWFSCKSLRWKQVR